MALNARDLLWASPPHSGVWHCFAVGADVALCCDVDWSTTREARFRKAPTKSDRRDATQRAPSRDVCCRTCVYLSGVDAGARGMKA